MRGILDAAEADKNRPLTAEERAEYDRIEKDVDAKGDEIETLEGDVQRAEKLTQLEESMKASKGRRIAPVKPAKQPGTDGAALDESVGEAISRLQSFGGLSYNEALRECVKTQTYDPATHRAMSSFLTAGWGGMRNEERAALQVDVDNIGGTLVVPEEFLARLIIFVNDRVFIRGISTVLPLTSADSIGVPSLETDPADADWTSELNIGGEDSTMRTGKRKLQPQPLGKLLKVSKTLLRKSAIPAESLVRDRLAYKFSITEEKAFLTGTGANQPLGVFTASDNGIPTSRDSSTGNTTTAVQTDGLIHCKFGLKAQYMASPNLRWVFHRTVVRDIRKLKDGNGQYLWQAGIGGTPDTILEVPYLMSEYSPNTMTTGLYVGIIGDFTWYWIAENLRFELQRLDELYAATNQVGFIGRMELDAMPVLAEAFSRLTLA